MHLQVEQRQLAVAWKDALVYNEMTEDTHEVVGRIKSESSKLCERIVGRQDRNIVICELTD